MIFTVIGVFILFLSYLLLSMSQHSLRAGLYLSVVSALITAILFLSELYFRMNMNSEVFLLCCVTFALSHSLVSPTTGRYLIEQSKIRAVFGATRDVFISAIIVIFVAALLYRPF